MVKIKCIGAGITSKGIRFTNDGDALYDVDDATASYLITTFPKMFIKIEKIVAKKAVKKVYKTSKE